MNSSHMQLLFYDSDQSVKPSDITKDMFDRTISRRSIQRLKLTSQLRCIGGDDYIQYVKEVLNVKSFFPKDTDDQDHLVMKEGAQDPFNMRLLRFSSLPRLLSKFRNSMWIWKDASL